MHYVKDLEKCRLCGSGGQFETIVDLGPQRIQGAFDVGGAPVPLAQVDNELVVCDNCGHVQTSVSVDPRVLYSNYWYSSSISDTMKSHLVDVAKQCVEFIDVKEKVKIVDIASNSNVLLNAFQEQFADIKVKKYGVDPSDIAFKAQQDDIELINSTFPCKLPLHPTIDGGADIITCIACLYDVDELNDFISGIHYYLADDGIFCFEVAYLLAMVENLSYDSIVAEHVNHFSLSAIERLVSQNGMELFHAEENSVNGGSILCFARKQTSPRCNTASLNALRMREFNFWNTNYERKLSEFSQRVKNHAAQLSDLLEGIVLDSNPDAKIHLYGASTKVNTILQYCDISKFITCAAERDPRKVGGKTITGIPIVSEEISRGLKPDYYLVGPYHFKEEILKREIETMKAGAKFIFPLPEIQIFSVDSEGRFVVEVPS